MSKPVQQSVSVIQGAKKQVNNLLSSPEFVHNRLELNSLFDRILTRLKFMGATLEPEQKEQTGFPPIKNFMGEKIVKTARVAVGDLNPKEAEKKVYLDKVNSLYDSFLQTDPSSILKNYTIPEDVLVIRGVAKRAGVEGYDKRELNVSFIEDIALAIEVKEEERLKQEAIDKAAQTGAKKIGPAAGKSQEPGDKPINNDGK